MGLGVRAALGPREVDEGELALEAARLGGAEKDLADGVGAGGGVVGLGSVGGAVAVSSVDEGEEVGRVRSLRGQRE